MKAVTFRYLQITTSLPDIPVYYIGGVDLWKHGPYTVSTTGIRNRLIIPNIYHFVELAPSQELWNGFVATEIIQDALVHKVLKGRTNQDVNHWIAGLPGSQAAQTRLITNQMISFLKGGRLEDSYIIFQKYYKIEITAPSAQDALMWLKSNTDILILEARPSLQLPVF